MSKKQQKNNNSKVRLEVLENAAETAGPRRTSLYGEPKNNLSCATELQEVYKRYAGDKYSPEHDIAIGQALIGVARIATGKPGNIANYTETAADLATAFECHEV